MDNEKVIAAEAEATVDAEVEQELAQEAAAKKQKKQQRSRTVLAAVCGALATLVVMALCALLTYSVPVVLFAAGPLSVWAFSRLFKGNMGKGLRWAAAIVGLIVLFVGTALDCGGIFAMTNGMPPALVFYVAALIMTNSLSWMFATAGASLLYTLIFSVLGFFLVWEFTGNPFLRKRGVKNVESAEAEAEEAEEETEEEEETDEEPEELPEE